MLLAASLAFAFALQASRSGTPPADANSQSAPQTPPAVAPSIAPEPDANGVYHKLLGVSGMTPPRLISQVEPEFSKEARKRKIKGISLVGLIVDAQGIPTNVHLVRSAAEDVKKPKDKAAAATLDQKALEAVSKYRFKPATLNGKPVPVEIHIEVNFQIF